MPDSLSSLSADQLAEKVRRVLKLSNQAVKRWMARESERGRDTSAADVDGADHSVGHHESVGERQGRQPAHAELPNRVVVGSNGAYWRDFGDFYSMCPTSDDNDPVEVVAAYLPARRLEAAEDALEEADVLIRQARGFLRNNSGYLEQIAGWLNDATDFLARPSPEEVDPWSSEPHPFSGSGPRCLRCGDSRSMHPAPPLPEAPA